MSKPLFYIVDVFAEEKYSGNQLAVFRSVQELHEKEMQQIAEFIRRLLIDEEDPRKVQGEVQQFRTNFQHLYYCFP